MGSGKEVMLEEDCLVLFSFSYFSPCLALLFHWARSPSCSILFRMSIQQFSFLSLFLRWFSLAESIVLLPFQFFRSTITCRRIYMWCKNQVILLRGSVILCMLGDFSFLLLSFSFRSFFLRVQVLVFLLFWIRISFDLLIYQDLV